jgi:hypothetical protein
MRLREHERQITSAVAIATVAVATVVVVVVVVGGVGVNGCVASASAPGGASRDGVVFPRGRWRRRSDLVVVE